MLNNDDGDNAAAHHDTVGDEMIMITRTMMASTSVTAKTMRRMVLTTIMMSCSLQVCVGLCV